MNEYRELNKKINMYYRQLGKKVFDKYDNLIIEDEEILLLISQIRNSINKIETSNMKFNIDKNKTLIKKILEPAKNKEGLTDYLFCKNCNVGNNPKSTHCINCGEKL